MAKHEIENEDVVVYMTDEDGNEFYYVEEMLLEVEGGKFALLTELPAGEGHPAGCTCGCEEEDAVIIAKVVPGEDGEDTYIEPTDEEFEKVQETYEAIAEAE